MHNRKMEEGTNNDKPKVGGKKGKHRRKVIEWGVTDKGGTWAKGGAKKTKNAPTHEDLGKKVKRKKKKKIKSGEWLVPLCWWVWKRKLRDRQPG